jgi:hypothetical protein
MELRKKGKKDRQETNFPAKNPTNDTTFRKLTVGEQEKKSTHVLNEYSLRGSYVWVK